MRSETRQRRDNVSRDHLVGCQATFLVFARHNKESELCRDTDGEGSNCTRQRLTQAADTSAAVRTKLSPFAAHVVMFRSL